MTNPVSACCFIKDTFRGAFCLFESMASLLPFVDELVVMDLGSTDGTLETLYSIAEINKRVRLVHGEFYRIDASVFASLANDLVAMCKHQNVLYYQADEIWHEDLLLEMEKEFQQGNFDLSFWRIQYGGNFQWIRWFPPLVHRVGVKGSFYFDDEKGDGMSSTRTWDAKVCGKYDGGWFTKWGALGQEGIKPYVNQMITDVSLLGGFRDNVVDRRKMHAPFWNEEPYIEEKPGRSIPAEQWYEEALQDPNWTKTESPYNLPAIMRGLVGMTKYELRPELFEALRTDDTRKLLYPIGGWNE